MTHVPGTVLTLCHAGLIEQHNPRGKNDDCLYCKGECISFCVVAVITTTNLKV